MEIEFDGDTVTITQDGAVVKLDVLEAIELSKVVFEGLCWACESEEINEGSLLCCDCFNAEQQWHDVHCETNGLHQ